MKDCTRAPGGNCLDYLPRFPCERGDHRGYLVDGKIWCLVDREGLDGSADLDLSADVATVKKKVRDFRFGSKGDLRARLI